MAGPKVPRVCVDKWVKLPRDAREKAALLRDKLWGDPEVRAHPKPGEAPYLIGVAFLDGSPGLQNKVREVASEWMEYAHLAFDFDADLGDADIRISFKADPGSWSFLGTDSTRIPAGEATMNFGWLTDDSPDGEIHRVVLHEFGHALGCVHEHSNPDEGIPWNVQKVYAHYKKLGWDEAAVDQNVLRRYSETETFHSRFDQDSIMLYPVDAELTDGKFSSRRNTELSELDRAFIAEVYPRPPRS